MTYNAGTGALTATEFHGGGGNLTGISAGISFSGSTANDTSGEGNHGTIDGAAWITMMKI